MSLADDSLQGYNQGGYWQQTMTMNNVDFFPQLLHESSSLSQGYLTIADYGCSEGLNSMVFFEKAIKEFRETSDKELLIVHNDVPYNNWAVFNNLFNTSPRSYLKLPGTYYSIIGRSFFERVFPANSVHVGFSAFAFHYLSHRPVRKEGVTSLIHDLTIEQGIKDIHTILRHRIDELCPSGTLTIVSMIDDIEPNNEYYNLLVIKPFSVLVRRGLITQDQFNKIDLLFCALKLEAWKETFNDFSDEIEVKHLKAVKSVSPFYEKYLEDGNLEHY